jgi:2-iminobutanoate/2-iminopropanoate deaminase
MQLDSIPKQDATHFVAAKNSGGRLPFSQAVQAGGLLFVSGQASVDSSGTIVQGTFEEEFRRSFANLKAVLEAAGSGLERVVQVRAYVRDPANLPLYNQLYREIFSAPYPARTTITYCLPEILHFEVECVATLPDSSETRS